MRAEHYITLAFSIFIFAFLTVSWLLDANDIFLLLGGAFSSIIGIVFGDDLKLFKKNLHSDAKVEDNKNRLLRSILSREAILPVVMLVTLILLGVISIPAVVSVFYDKVGILALIFSFAFISFGIGRVGYFKFAAFKIVEACNGNTARLALYLFILTSILTFFTSNDIVVLVLTPIIINVCFYSKIKNAKLLLLSQFIAANTLSMGMLIGSPTNIIVGFDQGITFVDYFILMFLPAIMSFLISFCLINRINLFFSERKRTKLWKIKTWKYDPGYIMPSLEHSTPFNPFMRWWIGFFIALVAWLAVVSIFNWSLWWVTLPAMPLLPCLFQFSFLEWFILSLRKNYSHRTA